MKKLLLFTILVFSFVISNAQRFRSYENNYGRTNIGGYPYRNVMVNQQHNTIQSSVLPSLIGAMVGAAIVNSINNKQYEDCSNYNEVNRDQHYENQLELERLEIMKKELEIIEMKKHYRQEHRFSLFGRKHYHDY